MKKGEIIQTGKRMVVEYFNKYVNKSKGFRRISERNVRVIGVCDETDIYRVLLIVPGWYGIYYGVSYNYTTNKINSYIYKKVGKRINGRKERK